MLMILTMTAMAQEMPTIVNETTHGIPLTEDECAGTGEDVYCYESSSNTLYQYDVSNKSMHSIGSLTQVSPIGDNYASCEYYAGTDGIYCFTRPFAGQHHIMFTTDLSTQLNLSDFTAITYSGATYPECDLRPSTDEIWCYWGRSNQNNNTIQYYDISDDTWTFVSEVHYQTADLGTQVNACDFQDSNTYICGGGEQQPTNINDVFVYDISGDTFTWGQLADGGTGHGAIIVDNIAYFIGMDDWNDPLGVSGIIVWYDPFTNTSGNYTQPYDITGWGGWATNDRVFYGMGNYINDDYDEFDGVISYTWASPVTPPAEGGWTPTNYSATHSTNHITGLVIDFGVEFGITAIALVGLIALVGIAVWVRGRL